MYNIKLILSCLKQTLTPTLALVTQNGTKSSSEVDGAKEAPAAEIAAVAEAMLEKLIC